MNLDDLKTAATRKVGPLPAWAWALIAGVGIYVYRKRKAAAAGTATTTTATAAAANPNTGTTLTPGESIVNPDGSLTTAPGGGGSDTSGGDGSDPNAALESTIGALGTAISQLGTTGNDGAQSPSTPPVINITNKIPSPIKAVTSKVTKRKVKPKKAKTSSKKPAKTAKPAGSKKVTRPRLPATIRNPFAGRTSGKSAAPAKAVAKARSPRVNLTGPPTPIITRKVSPTSSVGTRVRSRPTVPAIGQRSVVQHTVGTNPRPSTRPLTGSPPRPSAPPPRAQGRSIVKPAPKPVKKRG